MSRTGRGAAPPRAATRADARPPAPTHSTMARRENRQGLALISPTLIIVLVVVVAPIVWSIILGFQRVRLLSIRTDGLSGAFTLQNFVTVFSAPGFWSSLLTTLVFAVFGTFFSVAFGLIAALALRKAFRGRTIVRSFMLLPYVAPIVAVTYVWKTMLSPQYGVINAWGQNLLGWDQPIAFLSEKQREISLLGWHVDVPLALSTVIAFEVWRFFPFAFLFIMARLQAVPGTLEEAARVDGATPTQRFRYILLPQLMPTIAMVSVLRFIWTFNGFDPIYLLTGGGAGTEVISVRVFDFLRGRGDIGLASAQALVLAVILVVFVGIYLKRFAKQEEEA